MLPTVSKASLIEATTLTDGEGLSLVRRLWFMGRPLPVPQILVRLWRTGRCRFTDVAVNEYPIFEERIVPVAGDMAHDDSPDLDHWLEKQNRYTTAEAIIAFQRSPLADTPRLLGTGFQRRLWLKRNFNRLPFRLSLVLPVPLASAGTMARGLGRLRLGASAHGPDAPCRVQAR